jgi:hypothetical protein
MVFGIGEGKIELELDNYNVSPGGKISGKLRLDLNSPKRAKELRVELIGEQRQSSVSLSSGKRTSHKVVVFRSMQKLGGEQEYTSGVYEFELNAPPKQEAGVETPQEGVAGAIMGAAKLLKNMSPTEYYVVASLDLPLSMDISKKVRVSVV